MERTVTAQLKSKGQNFISAKFNNKYEMVAHVVGDTRIVARLFDEHNRCIGETSAWPAPEYPLEGEFTVVHKKYEYTLIVESPLLNRDPIQTDGDVYEYIVKFKRRRSQDLECGGGFIERMHKGELNVKDGLSAQFVQELQVAFDQGMAGSFEIISGPHVPIQENRK